MHDSHYTGLGACWRRLLAAVRLVGTLLAMGMPSGLVLAQIGQYDRAEVRQIEEDYIFTPPGFDRSGKALSLATDAPASTLHVRVRESADDETTCYCRVNVVGADGNYYAPDENPYATYSLLGNWPDKGQGNRPGKAPIRYFGHFFYTAGDFTVRVPPGPTRIEVARGFEHRPVTQPIAAAAGQTHEVSIVLPRTVDLSTEKYLGGDTHLHFNRVTDGDDELIFDLLAAEDIRFGHLMCYNETDRYDGVMGQLVMPQRRGLGPNSAVRRGDIAICSGQEYRNGVYGHLNLFWRSDLVLAGQSLDPNRWPVYGVVGRDTLDAGGFAFYAHGGYAQEIYADVVQGTVTGVELLQFGIYRGIRLDGWYRLLSAGYTCPIVGASDYPACRKLGDCRTYVECPAGFLPDTGATALCKAWLTAAAAGRGFVSSGPLLLFDVEGKRPGESLDLPEDRPRKVTARLRVRSVVAPVTHVQIIVNGRVVARREISPLAADEDWVEVRESLLLDKSSWVAARAYSKSPSGNADAEAHTNPVYVEFAGRATFDPDAARWLIEQLDAQIAAQEARDFPERAKVVAYFKKSRDLVNERLREGAPRRRP